LKYIEQEIGRELDILVVANTSKPSLCINSRINHQEFKDIEDSCLDLVSPWRAGETRCQYFGNYIRNGHAIKRGCWSLEDLLQTGKLQGVCPFYIQKDVLKNARVQITSQNLEPKSFDFDTEMKSKEILVIDECYELDERIAKNFTEPISKRFLEECVANTDFLNKTLKNMREENEKKNEGENKLEAAYKKLVAGLRKSEYDIDMVIEKAHKQDNQPL
jgi:hypothetical protein